MKVNYKTNEKGFIIEYTIIPFDPHKPWLEISNPKKIHLYWDKVENHRLICHNEQYVQAARYSKRIQEIMSQINTLKQQLKDTDYLVLKHAEGQITDLEFEPISAKRALWRKEINSLEKDLRHNQQGLLLIQEK